VFRPICYNTLRKYNLREIVPMLNVPNEEYIHLKSIWNSLKGFIDEKTKRLFAGAIVKAYWHGGTKLSHDITGLRAASIKSGVDIINGKEEFIPDRQRKVGGGRKRITEIYPEIKDELEKLIASATKGDPESPLLWTNKSTTKLAEELTAMDYPVSSTTVGDLLNEMGFSLQSNKKTIEGSNHPDRNEQFEYINERVNSFQDARLPVISVDTKKKELVGNYIAR
ncbi:MAG: hypothetical protein WA125_02135, partial [Desulfosporosinus sp.]